MEMNDAIDRAIELVRTTTKLQLSRRDLKTAFSTQRWGQVEPDDVLPIAYKLIALYDGGDERNPRKLASLAAKFSMKDRYEAERDVERMCAADLAGEPTSGRSRPCTRCHRRPVVAQGRCEPCYGIWAQQVQAGHERSTTSAYGERDARGQFASALYERRPDGSWGPPQGPVEVGPDGCWRVARGGEEAADETPGQPALEHLPVCIVGTQDADGEAPVDAPFLTPFAAYDAATRPPLEHYAFVELLVGQEPAAGTHCFGVRADHSRPVEALHGLVAADTLEHLAVERRASEQPAVRSALMLLLKWADASGEATWDVAPAQRVARQRPEPALKRIAAEVGEPAPVDLAVEARTVMGGPALDAAALGVPERELGCCRCTKPLSTVAWWWTNDGRAVCGACRSWAVSERLVDSDALAAATPEAVGSR